MMIYRKLLLDQDEADDPCRISVSAGHIGSDSGST